MEGQKCTVNREQNGHNHPQVTVLMVPFPAQGHLNQLLHLSHIIASYDIPVHYAASALHNCQAKLRLQGWDSQSSANVHFHDLELPPYSSPPPNPDPSIHFPCHLQPLFNASSLLRHPVSQLMKQLSTKFSRIIVIHDSLMNSVVQDVESIPNAESYTFMPISTFAMFLSYWDSIPDNEKPFQLDSDFPRHIPSLEGSLTPEMGNLIANQRKFLGVDSGRLFNTSRIIEGRYLKLLEKLEDADIKYFAIGPINPVRVKNRSSEKHKCLEWLDKQATASVIYVSFGSATSMNDEQIRELANGLERSEQKFIWVLRQADKGNDFTDGEQQMLDLPEDFEGRVKDRGIIVREWAPQLEILAHQATGGFMSHCGWNSCMESISIGVPIAAWPIHSEQPRNAFLVTEVLKIGTVVRNWEHRAEMVTSSTIENAVRTLMASTKGQEMRQRAAELGNAIRGSVTSKVGTSSLEMDSFIAHITR